MNAIYTSDVTVRGGREGEAVSSDNALNVKLSLPKEFGGPGTPGTTNPEQLFAAGYAACFESAVRAAAAAEKKKITASSIHAKVGVGPRDAGGFQLAVSLEVHVEGVSREEAEKFVNTAHTVLCPYSNAIRGNVDVDVRVV
jgi:osmotically inducible protein OsmC